MNHKQRAFQLVINALADGYQNFKGILQLVKICSAESGREPRMTSGEVNEALRKAIREGYIQSYHLSPHPPHSQAVPFSADRLDELWFSLTPKGRRLLTSFGGLECASEN
jgi:hypothetical protein